MKLTLKKILQNRFPFSLNASVNRVGPVDLKHLAQLENSDVLRIF